MPLDRSRIDRMITMMDAWLTQREQEARYDENEDEPPCNPLDAPPNAPFSDSPPEMPKEPLWNGKPPIPVEHL